MPNYPSWQDVNVPATLINSVKTLPPCYFLDSLVHQLVIRAKRKSCYIYSCDACGHRFKPDRSSEEITSCSRCNSYLLSCTVQLRFSKEITGYSKRTFHFTNTIKSLLSNYIFYFKEEPKEFLNVGWEGNFVYAQFKGGEMVRDMYPRLCLVRAMLLCPYLWDNSFDWNDEHKSDTINVDHIAPILHNYCGLR